MKNAQFPSIAIGVIIGTLILANEYNSNFENASALSNWAETEMVVMNPASADSTTCFNADPIRIIATHMSPGQVCWINEEELFSYEGKVYLDSQAEVWQLWREDVNRTVQIRRCNDSTFSLVGKFSAQEDSLWRIDPHDLIAPWMKPHMVNQGCN